MEKWNSTKIPPDALAARMKADAEKKKAEAPTATTSEPGAQPSSASSTTTSNMFPSLPFQMPAIHFHTGPLANGTGTYMASPSKPVIKKPAAADVSSSSFLSAFPARSFPATREFLATIDEEDADGGDSPNYSRFADILIEKGYRRIHLLFDETPKSLQNDLGLPISMGDAKQLLMHVKSACRKIALLDY